MARPKKEKPNRADGLYEVKATIGKNFDGTLIRKSFYSSISKADAKKQAEAYKVEHKVAQISNSQIIEKDITFARWADKWLEIYKKPNVSANTYNSTYKLYVENHIKPYFGNANIIDIKPIDVQNFLNTKSELSESTLNKIIICLRGIFDTAIDNDLCYKNPAKNATAKSEYEKESKRVFTPEQEEQVVKLIQGYKQGLAIIFCLETGLRPGEFNGLKWSDISVDTLTVNRSIAISKENGFEERPPKWGSYREIPLTKRAKEALVLMRNNDIYIYPREFGIPYTSRAWAKIVERFWDKVLEDYPDIPHLTPHELRHTFGTKLRRNGVDIYSIQKLLGHKNIKVTTETYVHNEVSELRKAMGL